MQRIIIKMFCGRSVYPDSSWDWSTPRERERARSAATVKRRGSLSILSDYHGKEPVSVSDVTRAFRPKGVRFIIRSVWLSFSSLQRPPSQLVSSVLRELVKMKQQSCAVIFTSLPRSHFQARPCSPPHTGGEATRAGKMEPAWPLCPFSTGPVRGSSIGGIGIE